MPGCAKNSPSKGPIIGFQLPGCFSEYALLPEIALTIVDDRISDNEAACLQSLSDSVAAVETAEIRIAERAFVEKLKAAASIEVFLKKPQSTAFPISSNK